VSSAEWYRNWLQGFPKEPEDRRAMALAAIDAFEAAEGKKAPIASELEPLVKAASSSHKLVYETGGNLLAVLARTRQEAQQCFLEMAQSKNATARFHAVAYLDKNHPEQLRIQVIEFALPDRSAKVRRMAVQQIEEWGMSDFLPRLIEMQKVEQEDSVQRSLDLHVPLLRDGYRIKPADSGSGFYLTTRYPDGSMGGPFISKEEFSMEFVRQELAKIHAGKG
jgi:hypothetical protein